MFTRRGSRGERRRLLHSLLPPLLLLQNLADEEPEGSAVDAIISISFETMARQPRLSGSHVTDRGCSHLQPGNLRKRRRPRPRERSLLCKKAVVLLVDLSLPGPGGCPQASWSTVLLRAVVRRSCQGIATLSCSRRQALRSRRSRRLRAAPESRSQGLHT